MGKLHVPKKILVLLILGCVLLGVGIAVVIYNENYLTEKYPELEVFFDGELSESQMSSTPIDLLQGDSLTVTVISNTHSHRVLFSLDGPDDSRITEIFFTDYLSFPLVANSTGMYVINIGNTDPQSLTITGFITDKPVMDEEFIKTMQSTFMISSIVSFLGIILIILSILILSIQKIRSKKRIKKITK
jgi:uncharacterized membrane protein